MFKQPLLPEDVLQQGTSSHDKEESSAPSSPAELSSSKNELSQGIQEAWARSCQRLRLALGNDVFDSWFGRLELENVSESVVHLSVPTRFLKSWIEAHYSERILGILSAEAPEIKSVVIEVRFATPSPGTRPLNPDSFVSKKPLTPAALPSRSGGAGRLLSAIPYRGRSFRRRLSAVAHAVDLSDQSKPDDPI